MASITAQLRQAKPFLPTNTDRPVASPEQRGNGRLKTIDDFRKNPAYAGDGNRIDLAYAVYALSHGVSETAVRHTLAIRNLSKKGPVLRQNQYIDRTIAKALSRTGLSR